MFCAHLGPYGEGVKPLTPFLPMSSSATGPDPTLEYALRLARTAREKTLTRRTRQMAREALGELESDLLRQVASAPERVEQVEPLQLPKTEQLEEELESIEAPCQSGPGTQIQLNTEFHRAHLQDLLADEHAWLIDSSHLLANAPVLPFNPEAPLSTRLEQMLGEVGYRPAIEVFNDEVWLGGATLFPASPLLNQDASQRWSLTTVEKFFRVWTHKLWGSRGVPYRLAQGIQGVLRSGSDQQRSWFDQIASYVDRNTSEVLRTEAGRPGLQASYLAVRSGVAHRIFEIEMTNPALIGSLELYTNVAALRAAGLQDLQEVWNRAEGEPRRAMELLRKRNQHGDFYGETMLRIVLSDIDRYMLEQFSPEVRGSLRMAHQFRKQCRGTLPAFSDRELGPSSTEDSDSNHFHQDRWKDEGWE